MLIDVSREPSAVKFEYFSRGQRRKVLTKKKGHMKSILLSIVCALAAPLAFAQVSTTTTEQTTTPPATTTETTTTTYTTGTVATYEPGKTIVVKSDEGPVSFALGTTAHIVNGAGQVVTSALRPGEHVRVYYTGTGNTRVVERVVVEEQPATTTETTTTTYAVGTVTTYEPGKTIVVKSEEGPVSFALGTAAHIVNGAGKVVTSALRPGQHVRVYYTGPVEHRTVERVVVED
jgi:hypothetical protein